MRTIYDWAVFYVINGFSVIPLNPRSKEPNFELLKAVGSTDADGTPTWKPYTKRRPTKKELEVWFKEKDVTQVNIGIVVGQNRAVLDIDDTRYYQLFFDKPPRELKTWVGRTAKGFHIYIVLPQSARPENVELLGAFELKAHDKYVVAPPSLHPSGVQYEWVNDIRRTGFRRFSEEDLNVLIGKIRFLKKYWPIIEPFSEAWSAKHRHNLTLGLCGYLRKCELDITDATKIIWAICTITADPELKDRLKALKDTYSKSLDQIAGVTKLREELEPILGASKVETLLGRVQENVTTRVADSPLEETDPEVRKEAEKLLEDPAILYRIHNAQGDVQGEDENKVLLPILMFAKQSFEVQGETSAGKNTIVDSALSLFPEKWWTKFTGLTDKSIRYLGDNIRTLYLAERRTMRTGEESTVEYDIKLLLSEGKLKVLTTVPDQEDSKRFTTEQFETSIENVILTSTEVALPQELGNRIWVIRADESRDQNARVRDSVLFNAEKLPSQKPDLTHEKKIVQTAFEIADREAPKDVVIPYATLLKTLLDEGGTRVRRDTKKLISLIEGVTRLHYRHRLVLADERTGEKVLVALPDDFLIAWSIGSTAIKETFTDLTERDTRVLGFCKQVTVNAQPISAKTLAGLMGRSDDTCQRYLRALQTKGLLHEEERGPHGLKIYSLCTEDRSYPGLDRIPTSEMKIKYERWLESQNLRSEISKAPPVIIDPITGIRAESILSASRSADLNERNNATHDFTEKGVVRPDSDLTHSEKPPSEPDNRDEEQDLELAKATIRPVKGPMSRDYGVEQIMKKGMDRSKAEACFDRLVNDHLLVKDPQRHWRLVK